MFLRWRGWTSRGLCVSECVTLCHTNAHICPCVLCVCASVWHTSESECGLMTFSLSDGQTEQMKFFWVGYSCEVLTFSQWLSNSARLIKLFSSSYDGRVICLDSLHPEVGGTAGWLCLLQMWQKCLSIADVVEVCGNLNVIPEGCLLCQNREIPV